MTTKTQNTPIAAIPDGFEQASNNAQALVAAIGSEFAERETEARSLMIATIAEEHVLLLGPPGTAKSAIANAFAAGIGGKFFSILLTKFTVPEEVFGPISLKGLENDRYCRVTAGYLPDCDVYLCDECFKGSSSILNCHLTALNERAFDDGGARHSIPLKLCVGASNELPQDDSLAALFDRFMLRHWVAPIQHRDAMKAILGRTGEPRIAVRMSSEELATLRAARDMVIVPDVVIDAMLDLKDALAKAHGIRASDRRWRKCVKLVRAHAVFEGRLEATRRDLLPLAHALWEDVESYPQVMTLIAEAVNPDLKSAYAILEAAIEEHRKLDLSGKSSGSNTTELARASDALKAQLNMMMSLEQSPEVQAAAKKVARLAKEVAQATGRKLGLGDLGI